MAYPAAADIAERFLARGSVVAVARYGGGLINDTFLVETDDHAMPRFILQRISREVFARPRQLMANLAILHAHISKEPGASIRLQIPKIITAGKALYFQDDDGGFWRALTFIDNSCTLQSLPDSGVAGQVGYALGHFHYLLRGLHPGLLHDTLPGFHCTPEYLRQYRQVLNRTDVGLRSGDEAFCVDSIAANSNDAAVLEDAREQGLLPLRVIHGDPKLDNFLFARDSGRVISLIDLDTVKPGLSHYDIGDCLRSCCQRGAPVVFDVSLCRAILQGYLGEVGSFFSEQDYRYLYPAIRLLPYELGLRFFTDHLQGNRYFKVTRPRQNLQRAVAQFQLLQSIVSQEREIMETIEDLQQNQAGS